MSPSIDSLIEPQVENEEKEEMMGGCKIRMNEDKTAQVEAQQKRPSVGIAGGRQCRVAALRGATGKCRVTCRCVHLEGVDCLLMMQKWHDGCV